jgi:hypothetical protein
MEAALNDLDHHVNDLDHHVNDLDHHVNDLDHNMSIWENTPTCAKCQYKYIEEGISTPRLMKKCSGCDIGYLCNKCWNYSEDGKYRCGNCEMSYRKMTKFERKKAEARIMLNEWMRENPEWEIQQKAEFLKQKSGEAEVKWSRFARVVFIEKKLKEFM